MLPTKQTCFKLHMYSRLMSLVSYIYYMRLKELPKPTESGEVQKNPFEIPSPNLDIQIQVENGRRMNNFGQG